MSISYTYKPITSIREYKAWTAPNTDVLCYFPCVNDFEDHSTNTTKATLTTKYNSAFFYDAREKLPNNTNNVNIGYFAYLNDSWTTYACLDASASSRNKEIMDYCYNNQFVARSSIVSYDNHGGCYYLRYGLSATSYTYSYARISSYSSSSTKGTAKAKLIEYGYYKKSDTTDYTNSTNSNTLDSTTSTATSTTWEFGMGGIDQYLIKYDHFIYRIIIKPIGVSFTSTSVIDKTLDLRELFSNKSSTNKTYYDKYGLVDPKYYYNTIKDKGYSDHMVFHHREQGGSGGSGTGSFTRAAIWKGTDYTKDLVIVERDIREITYGDPITEYSIYDPRLNRVVTNDDELNENKYRKCYEYR